MIWRPRPGQRVELHYNPRMRKATGLHLARGTVVVAGKGPGPINAEVRLDDGCLTIVPRGNLFKLEVVG